MARTDAFVAKSGRRPEILTISDRFFDENLIDFFERLLDDRRSLDDTFIVSARMRDVEKTLKNLDRVTKSRFGDVSPIHDRDGMGCKLHRKFIEKSKANSNGRTIEKRDENRGSGPPKIDVSGVPGPVQRPKIEPGRPCSGGQMRKSRARLRYDAPGPRMPFWQYR